ncbi:BNR-repeat neuraminidase N-terminal domain-containing protein [Alistipes finegoldii]|uniref:BNR-repeat neuraminidase N-terminal domain-containing protein n=1 Tax=Alistipes finegoldii TaxID=214856 RepID=UPI00248A9304|nr:BNR-repeat neuraminidase N-terminal domain-containing protein [Alistipes finegoldii]
MTYCVSTVALLFVSVSKTSAADTLYVHTPQIPILLDRTDDLLCEIRLNARSGEIFDGTTIKLDTIAANDVAALRLFYGGTEARGRKGLHFRPVNSYIPRDMPARTREAYPSYSVLQSEVCTPSAETALTSGEFMPEGGGELFLGKSPDEVVGLIGQPRVGRSL